MKEIRRTNEECKEIIFNYLGNHCTYCGSIEDLRLHHKLPIYLGGKNTLTNVEVACEKCHLELHKQIKQIYPNKNLNKYPLETEFAKHFNIKLYDKKIRHKKQGYKE